MKISNIYITIAAIAAIFIGLSSYRTTGQNNASSCTSIQVCEQESHRTNKGYSQTKQRGFPIIYNTRTTFTPYDKTHFTAAAYQSQPTNIGLAVLDVLFWLMLLVNGYQIFNYIRNKNGQNIDTEVVQRKKTATTV